VLKKITQIIINSMTFDYFVKRGVGVRDVADVPRLLLWGQYTGVNK